MRILIVNKFLYPNGGSETYIFELGKELELQGNEVQYFGMEHPNRIVGNRMGSYTSNMDFHNGSRLSKVVAPFKIIYSIESRKQIRKVLEDFAPEIVHINNINFQITPSILYEIRLWEKKKRHNDKSFKVNIVYTAHDYQWICPNHMFYIPQKNIICEKCINGSYYNCIKNKCIHNSALRSLLGAVEAYFYKWRKTYTLVDRIIYPSNFIYEKFSNNPIFESNSIVLHNFVDIRNDMKAAISKEPKLPDRYVLYFGRYDVQKGLNTLIAACKKLKDINFVFAGSGGLAEEIIRLPNAIDAGFKRGDELVELIRNADFSVYPSEWYENCPFSIIESIVYGTPVIGANIGGIPELLSSEDNAIGKLFEPGNALELSEVIDELWNDKEKIEEYSSNCLKKHFFDCEEYIQKAYAGWI